MVLSTILSTASRGEIALEPAPIALAPGGPSLADGPPPGWTHVAMYAQPKVARGDTSAVPELVMRYAETFGSVILASVTKQHDGDGRGSYRLAKIGVAHTIDAPAGPKLIDSSSPELDFIGGRVLASGEKELARLRQIARYETAVVFDVPAVMVRSGEHRDVTIRNFLWTSAQHGGLATAMWALEPTTNGFRAADEHFVWVPAGFKDERLLSVDAARFTFGVPGPRAFALLRLPEGDRVDFDAPLAEVAASKRFTKQSLQALAAGLSKAIARSEQPKAGTRTPVSSR